MLHDFLALAIFGSFTWFLVLSAVLIGTFFYSEAEENGFIAFVAAVAFVLINHFKGNVPILPYITWINVGVYLGIGLIYAVIRAYIFGRNLDKLDDYYLRQLKGNVFRWWFLFPISLITWVISDLISDIYDFIYDMVSNGFENVVKAGFNSKRKKEKEVKTNG